jgi:hypothetical protein
MSEINNRQIKLRNSEQGMVAIVTTMVLMVVISLIVLGFAQISRRNERVALDRQLSTQAFYAAESGVNDARNLIQQAVTAGNVARDKNDCGGTGEAGFYASLNPVIDNSHNVSYSCLLVDTTPDKLSYTDIGTTSTIVPMLAADSNPFASVDLEWNSKTGSTNPTSGCPTSTVNIFKPAAGSSNNWNCGYGVFRIDLVPTEGSNLSVQSLQDSTMTIFAVPFSSGGTNSVAYSLPQNNTNNRVGVRCTDTSCKLSITGLSANSYHMRLSSVYKDSSLTITPRGADGSSKEVAGAQAVIDSTGKAEDVLRRIQVRVPYETSKENQLSDYAIEMQGSLCKRYSIMQGYLSIDGTGVSSSNPLCQTSTTP